MNLCDMIFRRKSVRSYTGEPVKPELIRKIDDFAAGIRPLYPGIRIRHEIISRNNVRCILPWITPQLLAIFTEDADGALENAGFIYQQLELCIQSLGLGVCWLGMGQPKGQAAEVSSKDDGLKFVMMLAFGHPRGEQLRAGASGFKRKDLSEITDRADARLECARLAPSSINSQPWYFTHDGEIIHAYCARRGLLRSLGDMNRIDMGIALAHICVSNPETFHFFRNENAPAVKGCGYIGSFTL